MTIRIAATIALALGLLPGAVAPSSAQDDEKPQEIQDFTDVDPATLGIKPVAEREDEETGFVVGGKNSTALIRGLASLNGRRIADLEADMKPDARVEVGSTKGFLGNDERLLDMLAKDNWFVVEESGLTHRELAEPLLVLAAAGEKVGGNAFRYRGRRFRVRMIYSRGYQLSPFRDGTKTSSEAVLKNLDNGKEVRYSLLVPEMARRYGFYEGEGTPYRVDPRKVLEVLDFLRKRKTEP
jgi:hypothetical protein